MLEVLRSGRLSLGPTIDRFEELLAERIGAPYVAAVSSGTAGLHLLSRIAGLGPGDEAITSPISFAVVCELLHLRGRDPGLRRRRPAHAEPGSGRRRGRDHRADEGGRRRGHVRLPVRARRDARALRAPRARADRGLGRGSGRRVQGRGRSARTAPSGVFGFYPNKQLATGEGGVVFTHSEEEWQLVRSMRNQGRDYEGGAWFHHVRLGWNYRWTDVQAAIGIAQLEKLDRLLALRAEAAERYGRLLEGVGGRAALCRRRRPQAVVVRLRRRAAGRRRTVTA